MAQLKDLIVAGASRFLGKIYIEDSVTLNDTLILAKSQDLSGTADNRPALIVGGLPSAAHIEIDANEIQAKSSDTAATKLYLNHDGEGVQIGSYVNIEQDASIPTAANMGALRVTGGLSTTKGVYFGGTVTAADALTVSGKTTLSGQTLIKGVTKIENTLNVTGAVVFDSTLKVTDKLTVGGDIVYANGSNPLNIITLKKGDSAGCGVLFSGQGLTMIGSGESPSSLYSSLSLSATTENMYVSSDKNIFFYTNCQDIADCIGVGLNTAASFYPITANTGNLGTANNPWSSMTVTTATIKGDASINGSATINGNSVIKGTLNVIGATNLKGALTLGTYSNNSTPPTDGGIVVLDLRDATITPNSFGDQRFNIYFDQITDDFYTTTSATTPTSGSKWMSILHVKGWKNSYAAWELAGNADSTSAHDTLRFRQGKDSTWGAWQSVITDYNIGQYIDGRYVNVTGDTMTGALILNDGETNGLRIRRTNKNNESLLIRNISSYTEFRSYNETTTGQIKFVLENLSESNTANANTSTVEFSGSSSGSQVTANTFSGSTILATGGADASSKTTGDLRVSGGAGIAKKLYVGTDLNVGATATIASTLDVNGEAYFAKNITIDGTADRDQWIYFLHTNASTTGYDWRIGHQGTGTGDTNYFLIQSNQNTGTYKSALQIGLTSLNAVFGGSITSGGNVTPGTTGAYTLGAESYYWNGLYSNAAKIGNGTDASNTTSGALIVTGGVGISKKLYVGSSLTVSGATTINGNATLGDATSDTHKVNGNLTHNGNVYYANGTTYYVKSDGSAKFASLNVAGDTAITGKLNVGGNATLGDTTSDTHKVNGNLTHNGNVYYANGTTYYINSSGDANLKALTTNGAVKMNGNVASSNMTTGQLVVVGGVGVSGQLNAKSVRIDNAVKFEYNSTDKCVDVIFG